jgi:hypothetical protein
MFVTRGRPHLPPCPPSSPTLWERKGGLCPSPSPLSPFLSHAVGEEGGDYAPHLPPCPLLPQAVGEEGGLCPSPPPCPFLSHAVEAEGGISGAGAISRPSSPLSRSAGEGPGVRAARSAGEGPGVRAARSAGEGPGVRAALTSPLPPFLSHAVGEEGGMHAGSGRYFR